MASFLFYVLIFILAADFCLERYLAFLNIKNSKNALPSVLANIYDTEKYNQQQNYFRENSKFGMISSSFSFVVIILMFSIGGFAWLDSLTQHYVQHEIWTPIIFFGLLYFANDIVGIPFELYDTFIIEQKFGFNKVTPKLFVIDKLKGYAMSIIIGVVILYAIILIYTLTPDFFWLWAWIVITVFSLFMTMFYSEIIVPLFNKQTPLEPSELRSEIEKFAKK